MTNQIANPYAVLGVPPTATSAQVRDAYRRLAMEFHPDRRPDAKATAQMQRINRAWEMVSSPAARARYHAQSSVPPAAAYAHWGSAPRSARPRSAARPTWTDARPFAEPAGNSDANPLRWAIVLATVPLAFFLGAVVFGGVLPFPLLGLLLLFGARAVLRAGG
jgi:curved DNA-binding protein CbpA